MPNGMFKSIVRHRPKQLLAVYIEDQQIEVLRARRQWRTWEIDPTEQFTLPEGEALYEYLQRLNLRPRGRHGTALILLLPRTYYTFHREHYPSSLKDQLEEALTFDWHENTFHEEERTLHFYGSPVPLSRHLSVPVFTLQRDVVDKFIQVLGASGFQSFSIIPTALTYSAFLPFLSHHDESLPLEVMGRIIDPRHLEIQRFYNGLLLDSLMVGKEPDNMKLFRESLLCTETEGCPEKPHIHLICTDEECSREYVKEWQDENLPIHIQPIQGSPLSHWIRYLLEQDQIQTFDAQLTLKPWKTPKIVWPLLGAVLLYSLFVFYQVHAVHQLQETSRRLKKEIAQLETQWKPIEQLQSRIAKFQEDQKTLTEFSREGYPLREILTILTQTTPDDTWLNYLSVRKDQLMLRGESKSAIKYLPELSKVEGFTDVRFASPVTKNPSSDQERFNVQLQLDIEKLKKTIAAMPAEKSDEKMETDTPGEASAAPPMEIEQPPPDDGSSIGRVGDDGPKGK